MGYFTELNTMLGLPKDFDQDSLKVGKKYLIEKDRERAFPLRLAMLMVTSDWNFLGYAQANCVVNKNNKAMIEFEVLTLFNPQVQKLYKTNFLKAAGKTGEV